MILKVFVPAGEDFLGIAPGSAIVGSELPDSWAGSSVLRQDWPARPIAAG